MKRFRLGAQALALTCALIALPTTLSAAKPETRPAVSTAAIPTDYKEICNALPAKGLQHPYLVFNEAQKPAILEYIKTNKRAGDIYRMLQLEGERYLRVDADPAPAMNDIKSRFSGKDDHAAYQKYLHAQVRELMTRYAPIDIMWWDYSQGAMEGAKGWKAPELMDMVRSINPGVIMNNRLYAYSGLNKNQAGTLDLRCGDYITPERFIPRRGYPGVDWESCMTVSDKWGYNRYDTNIKSPETIIEKLVECVTKGGNLLLNVNPMADGTIPEKVAATMRGVGRWLNINGEAVYGTRAFMQLDQPATINRQGDIFVFLIPPPDKGPAQPPSEGTMKELTAGAEHARMQPLDATGYENDGGTAVTLPAGYSKALLLGDNTALPVVNGTVLFKAHEHSQTPCSVIKLSK